MDACRGRKSPLTGEQVCVVAAGGIFDGRGLAMALALGADAVWVRAGGVSGRFRQCYSVGSNTGLCEVL